MTQLLTNWAGNYAYRAARVCRPRSLGELRDAVTRSDRVRIVGTRHSFNDIADTTGTQIFLDRLIGPVQVAPDRRSVTVSAAARYGDVAAALAPCGLTLRNFASLPHISIAGAIATGTHGSGDHNRGLGADVLSMDIMLASGELRHCSPATLGETFAAVPVSLGALGAVVRVQLAAVAQFKVSQHVYEGLPWDAFERHLDEITASAYSVSMFTDYSERGIAQVWLKRTSGDPPAPRSLFGAQPADGPRNPVPGADPRNTTEQGGVPGPAAERLPHFRAGFVPSSGEELQSEYLVARADALPAVRALRGLAEPIGALLQVAEIRTVAADDLWLSPAYHRDSVALHFTWRRDQPAVEGLLDRIEAALAPFRARPHWGKVFRCDAARLLDVHPELTRFARLAREWDPQRRFANAFFDRCAGAG